MNKGYDYPYAGVAFNVTGNDQTGGNATDWGGLDVCYVAECKVKVKVKVKVKLAPENEATVTEYDVRTQLLP